MNGLLIGADYIHPQRRRQTFFAVFSKRACKIRIEPVQAAIVLTGYFAFFLL